METKPYYLAYEDRYRAVYAAGAERWGHSPEDGELYTALRNWVIQNDLIGKRILEFACGEGAGGVILSELGCQYHGVDISPSAVEKARGATAAYPHARVDVLDMVRERTGERYDAALDVMGLHMLVTDGDRQAYLRNASASLLPGAPMLLYKESYRDAAHREEIVREVVPTYGDWLRITGNDYTTPSRRRLDMGRGETEILIPFVPARARDREGYIAEMEAAGFTVEDFVEMAPSSSIQYAASLYLRKME